MSSGVLWLAIFDVGLQTVIMGHQLKASIVFSSMTVFDILREQLFIISPMLNQTVSSKASLDRVNDFLKYVCSLWGPVISPLI